MIGASHPFQQRSLNALDENGNEGCARCGRPRDVHPPAPAPDSFDSPDGRTYSGEAPGQAAREFSDRITVFPDSGIVELNCFRCKNVPLGSDTWQVGYHPSLDVLVEHARAHDAAKHGGAAQERPAGGRRMILGPCPSHPGQVHAQIPDEPLDETGAERQAIAVLEQAGEWPPWAKKRKRRG